MDFLAILDQYGFPIAVAMGFAYFIWKQNKFIQETLMDELDQDFKRLEGIIIKLIDQQKKMQIELRGIKSKYDALVKIITNLIKEK